MHTYKTYMYVELLFTFAETLGPNCKDLSTLIAYKMSIHLHNPNKQAKRLNENDTFILFLTFIKYAQWVKVFSINRSNVFLI